jgi:deoxyribose-phosphate aldolase
VRWNVSLLTKPLAFASLSMMTPHDEFAALVSRITTDVLRGMGYAMPAAPAPEASAEHACTLDSAGWCNGCGQCPRFLPEQVGEFVDAGAARIGGGLGVGEGIKDHLAGLIDHTLLKPQATEEDLRKLCAEAKKHRFASVCVNAANVAFCARELSGSGVPIAAVVGFPLGATTPEIKALETRQAIDSGASEIDMVLNVGALKDRNYQLILEEIACVVRAARGRLVKVILETALLNDIEKVAACALAKAAGAHYVKTSTGFGPGGATVEDIALMRLVVGPEAGRQGLGRHPRAGQRAQDDPGRSHAHRRQRLGRDRRGQEGRRGVLMPLRPPSDFCQGPRPTFLGWGSQPKRDAWRPRPGVIEQG